MMPGIADMPAVGTETGAYTGGTYSGGGLDTQTITVGSKGSAVNGDRQRGYILSSMGGIQDGTSNLYAGAVIRELAAIEDGDGTFDVIFTVTGVVSNSGWNTINIGGSFYLARAAATFSTAGGNSSWTWPGAGNAFGSSGAIKTVGFD